jgi:phytoene synthase
MTMTFDTQTWEPALWSLAYEATRSIASTWPKAIADRNLLRRAYQHCTTVTRQHSRSFYLASTFLPADQRHAVRALYAFCRVTDDIVDCGDCDVERTWLRWRRIALSTEPQPDQLVALAWADARRRYHIPQRYAEQLLDGVLRDLYQQRYQTFDELTAYAYGVASTVGLMSMHIVGFESAEAIPYAIKLGVALQLTNILRDVGEDWRAGRVYLPADELAAFGLSEADLARGTVDDRWRAFMRFQIDRNRRLYAEAWPGIRLLNRQGRMAIAAAGALYREILTDVEARDYDVFNHRAHVGARRKLLSLPKIWWDNR